MALFSAAMNDAKKENIVNISPFGNFYAYDVFKQSKVESNDLPKGHRQA